MKSFKKYDISNAMDVIVDELLYRGQENDQAPNLDDSLTVTYEGYYKTGIHIEDDEIMCMFGSSSDDIIFKTW